ncbi:MAG: hypothetical protein KBH06_06605 [Spirochaetes bacterium]|nr:hypothetical protein [Spirochaetota bacterium]
MKKYLTFIMIVFTVFIGAVESSYNYDPNYEVNKELKDTLWNGYRLQFDLNFTTVLFADPNNPMLRDAYYNLDKQYYGWKTPNFDSSKFDLTYLYKKIDLSKTTLDRMEPKAETVYRDTSLEDKDYDYSKDPDFAAFMAYCDKTKVKPEVKQFYLRAANNSAKRGRLILDQNKTLSDAEVGIQQSAFKPPIYKNQVVPYDKRNGITYMAGGMQLYFEFRKKQRYVYPDKALNIFKDNKAVPLVIVELEPKEGNTGPVILRGESLVKKAKADLEAAFKKNFRITTKTMTISYSEFADAGKIAPLTHYSNYLAKHVNPSIPKNSLIIYYFTDAKRLLAIDRDGSHPLEFGPYATDWERLFPTIVHEFGHSLQLRHHFNDTDGSSDIKTHISPSCIMNYKYRSNEFCPLCKYGLGVN